MAKAKQGYATEAVEAAKQKTGIGNKLKSFGAKVKKTAK